MFPDIERAKPQAAQIADFYTGLIRDGELRPGDRMPPIREIGRRAGVSQGIAQHAVALLKSAKLVATSPQGTVVAEPRNVPGPQERAGGNRDTAAQRIEWRSATLVSATEEFSYIRPILGASLPAAPSQVIRREWRVLDITGAHPVPYKLAVAWAHPKYARQVPELLQAAPLPGGLDEAWLIAGRAGLVIDWGEDSREARRVLDDGREGPLLELGPDGYVLAETYKWGAGEDVLAYTEFIVREGRVIVTELRP